MRKFIRDYDTDGINVVCRIEYEPDTLQVVRVTPLLATLEDGHEVEEPTALALLMPQLRAEHNMRIQAEVLVFDDILVANERENDLYLETLTRLNGELV